MWRVLGWLGIVALAAYAHWTHSDIWRGISAFAVILFIATIAPRTLRPAVGLLALSALGLLAAGGITAMLVSLPALISAFISWLFARTLCAGRRPLIARAIAIIDGQTQLEDLRVARYARRLTWLWAVWQAMLALLGLIVALHANGQLSALPQQFPNPTQFGVVILPLAVALLFLAEFLLRPRLLPQAPKHSFWKFASRLVRAWPDLLGD